MSLTMYQASVPAFLQMLASLSAILDKAEAHAAARKIEPAVLLNTRLTPDMLPLVRQVQLASDFAKGTAARFNAVITWLVSLGMSARTFVVLGDCPNTRTRLNHFRSHWNSNTRLRLVSEVETECSNCRVRQ